MRTNLPKEMDFVHEARNADRARADFENVQTSMYIPKVITAKKRVLIMEFIQGGRVDDLKYLAEHHIDRNKVAVEISRIFSQMVFNNGWFHAVSELRSASSRLSDMPCRTPTPETSSSDQLPRAQSPHTISKSCYLTMDFTSTWIQNSG